MDNKKLFAQAIADAKTVRDAALANAKATLEESLSPKIQSMLQAKLQEMEDKDETLDESDDKEKVDENYSEDNLDEDIDLSEILAELELDEAKADDDDKKDDKEEDEDKEDTESDDDVESDVPEFDSEESGEIADDTKVSEITVDELRDLISGIIAAEMGAGVSDDMGVEPEMDTEPEMGMEPDMGAEPGMDMGMGSDDIAIDATDEDPMQSDEDLDEVDLEELLAELDALDETPLDEAKKEDKKEKDVNESLKTIDKLRKELNEVNLLNAKLIYVNKIFKAKNLSETQKVRVLEAFDKARNVKETKLVYESLNKALTVSSVKKQSIKENLGFASKSAGVAPGKQIVEVNETISRMQFLAGIKNKK